jgi:hypothetical protein
MFDRRICGIGIPSSTISGAVDDFETVSKITNDYGYFSFDYERSASTARSLRSAKFI